MSIWNKIIESVGGIVSAYANEEVTRDASKYALVDCEVGMKDKRVHDIGALRWDGAVFHSARGGRHHRPAAAAGRRLRRV